MQMRLLQQVYENYQRIPLPHKGMKTIPKAWRPYQRSGDPPKGAVTRPTFCQVWSIAMLVLQNACFDTQLGFI